MEYRRCQGKSYMIREMEENVTGYQLPMLKENVVSGILPMQKVHQGENIRFWYEISGKNDLEGYVRFHKLGRKFLETFIISLHRASQNLGEYLLSEDGISLNPEMIYLNHNEKEISFCYVPGNQKKLEDSLRNFMEFFLKNMEHGEQEDIEVCYRVYEQCQMEHVSLPELVEIAAGSLYHMEHENNLTENPDTWNLSEASGEKPQESPKKRERIKIPGKDYIGKKRFSLQIFRKNPPKEEEQFIFEPEEFVEESSNPTVFLGSESKEILGELRYEGDGAGKNFKLDVPVFLIGSQEGEANGVIFASSVSRHHAIICKEEENYYIEDLNSTNGTYLNGEMLHYKERVLLSKNDRIRFAGETYRFV